VEWVKYNPTFLFIPLIGTHLQVRPVGGRSRVMAINDADSRKDVPFLGFVDMAPHFRGSKSPKPQFLRRE